MRLSSEILVLLLAAGLYLYDSILLLYCDEGVIAPRGDHWRVRFGSRVRLRGREFFLPNLLLPHRPVFRLTWRPDLAGTSEFQRLDQLKTQFGPLGLLVWLMAIALFVIVPLGFFTRLGESLSIAAICMLYGFIVAALVWVGLHRQRFQLTGGRFVIVAIEVLICSPFGINLVRRLSTNMAFNESLLDAARNLQRPEHWIESRKEFIDRLQELIDVESDDSNEIAALRASQKLLSDDLNGSLPKHSPR